MNLDRAEYHQLFYSSVEVCVSLMVRLSVLVLSVDILKNVNGENLLLLLLCMSDATRKPG